MTFDTGGGWGIDLDVEPVFDGLGEVYVYSTGLATGMLECSKIVKHSVICLKYCKQAK